MLLECPTTFTVEGSSVTGGGGGKDGRPGGAMAEGRQNERRLEKECIYFVSYKHDFLQTKILVNILWHSFR